MGGLFAVALMICVTKVAKSALESALAENEEIDGRSVESPSLRDDPMVDMQQPLLVKIDDPPQPQDNQER